MRRQHHDEQDEVGWISLVDLLTVLVLIGAVVAVGYTRSQASELDAARKAKAAADAKVGGLQEGIDRANKAAGDWKVVADSAKEGFERLRGEIGKDVQTLIDQRAKAIKDLQEALANQAKLDDQLSLAQELASQEQAKVKTLLSAIEAGGLKNPLAPPEPVAGGPKKPPVDNPPDSGRGGIGQELLGFPGKLERVVFVVDRSQSMTTGDRWKEAKQAIQAYIKYLPVSHTALVVFGSDIKTIPSSLHRTQNQLWNTQPLPAMTPELRELLTQELGSINPQGETRTRRALYRAMEFEDLDAIILFTDGAPDSIDGGDSRESVMKLVLDWKDKNPNAHIHTVGIGDYFNESMRDFLLGIARATEGGFVGK